MTELIRCSSCKRHIYASETSCPFCTRSVNATSASLAVALTTAASIALAGCANDPPKPDPATTVVPETRKTEATQAPAKPEPPPNPAPTPTAVASDPQPAPSASVATTDPAPVVPKTPTTAPTAPTNPTIRTAPAYGVAPPSTTTIKRTPPAAYGGPPPRIKDPNAPKDPIGY